MITSGPVGFCIFLSSESYCVPSLQVLDIPSAGGGAGPAEQYKHQAAHLQVQKTLINQLGRCPELFAAGAAPHIHGNEGSGSSPGRGARIVIL